MESGFGERDNGNENRSLESLGNTPAVARNAVWLNDGGQANGDDGEIFCQAEQELVQRVAGSNQSR